MRTPTTAAKLTPAATRGRGTARPKGKARTAKTLTGAARVTGPLTVSNSEPVYDVMRDDPEKLRKLVRLTNELMMLAHSLGCDERCAELCANHVPLAGRYGFIEMYARYLSSSVLGLVEKSIPAA